MQLKIFELSKFTIEHFLRKNFEIKPFNGRKYQSW